MTDYEFKADRDIISFINLSTGDMFVDEDEKPFIKTPNIGSYKTATFKAVRISDGAFCYFADNAKVVRIKKAVFTV